MYISIYTLCIVSFVKNLWVYVHSPKFSVGSMVLLFNVVTVSGSLCLLWSRQLSRGPLCFGWMEQSKPGSAWRRNPVSKLLRQSILKIRIAECQLMFAWMMDLLQLFSTTLLQSKQWCFDNKANKWKQVFFMTSMYCFITDWFCSFFTFKLVKLRWFLGSKSRCKLKWRSKSQQHFWPKIWCFKKPLQFCQNIPPLEEENHLHIAFFRGYDSFMECLSRCLLLLKIFSHIGKSTCVVNFNQQARVLVRSNQLLPTVARFSRCVRWWPIILSSWVWLMHMAFQPYIMPWCRVTLSSFPRCLLKKHGGKGGWVPRVIFGDGLVQQRLKVAGGINSLAFDRPAEMRWCVTAIGPSGTVYVREI